jgi:hypothetical protein
MASVPPGSPAVLQPDSGSSARPLNSISAFCAGDFGLSIRAQAQPKMGLAPVPQAELLQATTGMGTSLRDDAP